jgi:hypothetical protein
VHARRVRAAALLAGLLVLGLAGLDGTLLRALGLSVTRADSALAAGAAQAPTAGDAFTPELGLPATDVVAIGASPNEAHGEVWAYGELGNVPASVGGQSYSDQYTLLQRTAAAGWQVVPLPPGPEGKPLAPSSGGGSMTPAAYGVFAGQTTAAGGVVLLSGQNVVVRNPDGQPQLAPAPTATGSGSGAGKSEVLAAGESLLPISPSGDVTLPYAAIEGAAAASAPHTGVLIAPYHDGGKHDPAGEPESQPGVLHYDGETEAWTREPIELPSEDEIDFTALALACGGTADAPDASSPQNCWLLASAQVAGTTRLLLFRRVPSSKSTSGYVWDRQPVTDPLLGEGAGNVPVTALAQGAQMLTVTAQGAWVDFQAKINPPAGNGAQESSYVSELVLPGAGTPSGGSTPTLPPASVAGTWCYPTGPGCEHSLGERLPAQYRSFAWPGASESDPGTRVITGLPDRAMLELSGGSFAYTVGAGGETGQAPGGAAFDPPGSGGTWEGWIADGANPSSADDGEGQSQVIVLAPGGTGDQLQEESVPFRRPLLAVAQAPGSVPGEPGAQAIAVGVEGQIAHYIPGQGWRPEALYDSAGRVKTPTLRGVAWPEPGRAYAVGDEGEMWVWRAETGLWEPDPAKPYSFVANLTAIAFSPSEPQLGYAVGKQGTLLRYGKTWEQVPLPAELQQVNFTSVAFAGGEALAAYRVVAPDPQRGGALAETGGIAVEEAGDGEHWHVDPGASALLSQLPLEDRVLAKVAGLPDGGAVAAGPGKVLERDSSTSAWRFSSQPLPEAQNVSALAAYREGSGPVRAVVSIDLDRHLDPESFAGILEDEESPFKGDVPPPTGPGQPPPFLEPDPLPNSGYLLKEAAGGWSDMEHATLPALGPAGGFPQDMPIRPDPVLALLVNPSGASGLAVGGQTGNLEGKGLNPELHYKDLDYQTAAAQRFPASAASTDGTSSPVPVLAPPGVASFVVAGQAACAQESCANFAAEDLGPDAWLTHALQSANGIAGASGGTLRAFLYTGGRIAADARQALDAEAFQRELGLYASLLGSGGGGLAIYPAASATDLAPGTAGIGPFTQSIIPPGVTPGPPGTAAYSLTSTGPTGDPVKVIVLDFSSGELGGPQREWLARELQAAREPAIVMGNASLGFALPQQSEPVTEARDASAVARILVEDGASGYFFDYPGSNVKTLVSYGTRSIPAYGTGTLGYVNPPNERFEADSLGSSGYLLASVPATHGDQITAEVIPNIGSLALDATNGVLLRRSQVALFEALARRPPAGVSVDSDTGGIELAGPDPYDQIPFDCQGPNCAYEVPTQYTFTSSNPDIANFVAHEAASDNPRQVQLGANKLPIPDEPRNSKGALNTDGRFDENDKGEPINEKGEVISRDQSGLLCAYNEGTTIISIATGGLTYSEPVTVQGGSVEYPCGTVPLTNPPAAPARARLAFSPTGPAPTSAPPASPQLQTLPPAPAPLSPALPPPVVRPPALVPFLPAPPLLAAVPVIVPPLSPTIARPTPPNGTAEVFEPMPVTQKEREDESAEETAQQFSAYHPDEGPRPGPWLLLGLVVIAAGAGVGIGRSNPGRRSRRRDLPALARAGARGSRRHGQRG